MTDTGGPSAERKPRYGVPTDWPSEPRIAIKHRIYRVYAQCWMGKICQTKGLRGAIVDGFGGAGRYPDGAIGSPIEFGRAYREHQLSAKFEPLELVCGDMREDVVAQLAENVAPLRGAGLSVTVNRPDPFHQIQPELARRLHDPAPGKRPVLWVLDPADWNSLPFSVVRDSVLSGPRDEVIVTFFADAVYRFLHVESHAKALSRYFGDERWRTLREEPYVAGVLHDKICEVYEEGLRKHGLKTSHFGIATRAEAPLYHLVFATHHPKGLECWQGARWAVDRGRGSKASAKHLGQGDLFGDTPDIVPLVTALKQRAGHEHLWADLEAVAAEIGFKPTHLRSALTELAESDLAVRVRPAEAATPWPDGCTVRIFRREDVEAARRALDDGALS